MCLMDQVTTEYQCGWWRTARSQHMSCTRTNCVFKITLERSQTSMINHASDTMHKRQRNSNGLGQSVNTVLAASLNDNTERFAIANVLHSQFRNQATQQESVCQLHSRVQIGDVVHTDRLDEDVVPVSHVWKQLNNLRVMHRFIRNAAEMTKTNNFLCGAPETCVLGLQWMSTLQGPMQKLDAHMENCVKADIDCASKLHQMGSNVTEKVLAFQTNRLLVCPDENHVRHLLSLHTESASELDVQVCTSMLRDQSLLYTKWVQEFPNWRDKGLFYPLAVAASYMPSLDHWLPRTLHNTPLATAWQCTLQDLNENGCHPNVFSDVAGCWNEDKTHTSTILGSMFDRIAVLMRVKSDGRNTFSLDKAMSDLRVAETDMNMHAANRSDWLNLCASIENSMPPSVLCRKLSVFKRPTWGYGSLDLQVMLERVLCLSM